MSKARQRRLRSRAKSLANLALKDRKAFRQEWSKRLESWANLAGLRADSVRKDDGTDTRSAFEVIDQALEELARYGELALAIEASATVVVLNAECSRRLAQAIDARMHRLANTVHVCECKKYGERV